MLLRKTPSIDKIKPQPQDSVAPGLRPKSTSPPQKEAWLNKADTTADTGVDIPGFKGFKTPYYPRLT